MPTSEEELAEAIRSGDMIVTGSTIVGNAKENTVNNFSLKSLGDFHQTTRYNHPIGIDFTKCLPPPVLLTSMEVITIGLDLSDLSPDLRYILELLGNALLGGKIPMYSRALSECLSDFSVEMKIKSPEKITKKQQRVFLFHLLSFLIPAANPTTQQWVNFSEIQDFVDSPNQKTFLKEWRNLRSSKNPKILLLLDTIVNAIQATFPLNSKSKLCPDLRDLIRQQKFTEILTKIQPDIQPAEIITKKEKAIKSKKVKNATPTDLSVKFLISGLWVLYNSLQIE